MKERPILFNGKMVRAILDDRKTQTRRIGKTQGNYVKLGVEIVRHATKGHEAIATHDAYPGKGTARHGIEHCRFGVPGDRLWVRETFATLDCHHGQIVYRADGQANLTDIKWKPSILMPRKASRITLEIVSVRVERLNEIKATDCIAEGIEPHVIDIGMGTVTTFKNYQTGSMNAAASTSYRTLWESINGKGSWAKNPWVWVVEFKRL